MTELVALAAGLLVLAGFGVAVAAFAPPRRSSPAARPTAAASRIVVAVVVALVVAAGTRWPTGVVAAVALVLGWSWLFGSPANRVDRERTEAIAKWLDDLRDVLRGSSVTVEEALDRVALRAPSALEAPLHRFELRRRQGLPIAEALHELADATAHPMADAAIAAMLLTTAGGASGARLWTTFDELSSAARDEVRLRDANDRVRAIYQRSMRRLVVLVVAIVAGLVVMSPGLLEPYRAAAGQAWLAVPIGVWIACLVWLRRLCTFSTGARYRLRLDGVRR